MLFLSVQYTIKTRLGSILLIDFSLQPLNVAERLFSVTLQHKAVLFVLRRRVEERRAKSGKNGSHTNQYSFPVILCEL